MNREFASVNNSQEVAISKETTDYLNYIREKKNARDAAPRRTEFIFADERMLRIKEVIHQIADNNVPVLITGESGVGKNIITRMIHAVSQRKNEPYINLSCSSMSKNILNEEIFGNSFNPSKERGKLELANNGTLVLDEINELDLNTQSLLLNAMQNGSYEKIGSNQKVNFNARIIATTTKDLAQLTKEGSFRKELFYRLHVIHIDIPPLRDRKKDIEVLTRHFLKAFGTQFKNQPASLTADAMNKLIAHPWNGNVRELQNIVQRAVLMSNNLTITADQLLLESKKKVEQQDWISHLPIGKKMRDVETHFILETLKSHNGNRTHSAKTLGISLRTLRNKINEFAVQGYDIPQPTSGRAL